MKVLETSDCVDGAASAARFAPLRTEAKVKYTPLRAVLALVSQTILRVIRVQAVAGESAAQELVSEACIVNEIGGDRHRSTA